jgi:cytochrome c553
MSSSSAGSLLASIVLFAFPHAGYAASPADQEFGSITRLDPNAARGRELFDACAACHGDAGTGARDGTVPAIAGQHFNVIVWSLVSFRNGGRLDPRMQHFSDPRHLAGTQDIADVATYASRLQAKWSPAHEVGSNTPGAAEIYRRDCASCHGARALGDDAQRYPRLAGQHYQYLLKRLRDATENRRSTLAQDHPRVLESLDSADLLDVSLYLSHLGP